MREGHRQRSKKANVWVVVFGGRVIGPIFFEGALKGTNYLEYLQKELIPNLTIIFSNPKKADVLNRNIWFHQDGAPARFTRPVWNFWIQYFNADGLLEGDLWNF